MCRDENGLWSIHLDDIEPGDHQFKYCVDGRDWYPDFAAHGVELDDHGEWRSLLIVNDIEREPMLQFQGIEVLSAKTGVSDPAFAPAVARVHELPSHAAAADPRRQAA
jgi:hypothetical protein